ncbi:grasp-with-spasm system SPASM domain peptide maturase [Psychroserpens algicola]|uniref:Grasp-with-spasm system SPASM domain peptide maturase n=1 Tax=Psychroserpens algicola TaxID=1719034 RepID=A0ABT0HC43_9FLAO|nr:grasp-with-spasm system SPASM domain peptide maturase [Psychroserpens algicola]MCK8481928.1 grasp-with-spasm system SPASM domain peptide maturase [Psychroserpens algicola]
MMKTLNKYFILFNNCIPVKGASRSIICDLQNQKYVFIPNNFYTILKDDLGKKISEIYEMYGASNEAILDEYFSYLIDNNLGFVDDEPELFPELNLDWDFPSAITNAQIDIDAETYNSATNKAVISELSAMNCQCVEFRFYKKANLQLLTEILNQTKDSRINEIRLILPFDEEIETSLKEDLLYKHQRINGITFHSSQTYSKSSTKGVHMFYLKDDLDPSKCGEICPLSFVINVESFTESVNFNNCLNKKVAIDKDGYIKNCGSQSESFGNVNDTSLAKAISDSKFQKLWHLKKDDIEVCKDCEFRYICTDCRMFKKEDSNVYSKPKKCTYDPYSTTWA